MDSLINTQIAFIKAAQAEYKEAVEKQSAQAVDFWLIQLHHLCQQLYWLQSPATNIVQVRDTTSTSRSQSLAVHDVSAKTSVEVPMPLAVPTSYAWNDGFQGVTLDPAMDDEEW